MTPDDLFSEHKLLPIQLAKKMYRTMPPQVTLDELHAAALEGLWRAVESWNSERGASFKSHAYTVINRTIITWLRTAHWRKDSQRATMRLNQYDSVGDDDFLVDKKDFLEGICAEDELAHELRKLPDSLRRLVVGYFLYGYSVREMADRYKMSPLNIYALLRPYRLKAGVKRNQSSYTGARC